MRKRGEVQFQVTEDNPGNPNVSFNAVHPEHGEIARMSVKVRQSRRFPERGMEPVDQPQVKGLYVHPDFQRQGIGTQLYSMATEHVGSSPMHDAVMTPEAVAWASKVGGAMHPNMQEGMSWDDATLRKQFKGKT